MLFHSAILLIRPRSNAFWETGCAWLAQSGHCAGNRVLRSYGPLLSHACISHWNAADDVAKRKRTARRFHGGPFECPGDDLLSRSTHYHGPRMLNGRVRNGNGCGHPGYGHRESRVRDERLGTRDEKKQLPFSPL